MSELNKKPVPVSVERYSQDYFLEECEGYVDYLATCGEQISPRLAKVVSLLNIIPGMRILDVGSGRGETLLQCARMGALSIGIDYSPSALSLTGLAIRQMRARFTVDFLPSVARSDAKFIPFASDSFDRVVMSDVVEHLHDWELRLTLKEVYRILRPSGCLVIHTMPNLWYYHFGYPVYRCCQLLRGLKIPKNPKSRWQYADVHVNEQTPNTLRHVLKSVGFESRVWVEDYRDYSHEKPLLRLLMILVTRVPLLRLIFCDDIFALAYK